MRSTKTVIACLLGSSLWLASPLAGHAAEDKDPILVIVNKSVTATTITREELRPLFQTKKADWPDGAAVRPFNLPASNPARHGFDAAALGLDPERASRYWIDRKIRGGEPPPKIAPSSAVMVKVVGATPGAIGYVDSTTPLDANVRVIAKIVGGQIVAP